MPGPETAFPLDEPNQLFRGGPSGFREVTSEAGAAFAASFVTRGALHGDLDNDGDTDLVFTNNAGPARVLRNDLGNRNGWVGATLLVGKRPDHGAVLELKIDGRTLLRRGHTDGGYASSNDPRILVGVGDASRIGSITVTWSDGAREAFPPSRLGVGAYRELVRGTGDSTTRAPEGAP